MWRWNWSGGAAACQIAPARKRRCARRAWVGLCQRGEQLPALHCRRPLLGHPGGEWHASPLGPVPEQGRLPNTPPAE